VGQSFDWAGRELEIPLEVLSQMLVLEIWKMDRMEAAILGRFDVAKAKWAL